MSGELRVMKQRPRHNLIGPAARPPALRPFRALARVQRGGKGKGEGGDTKELEQGVPSGPEEMAMSDHAACLVQVKR
eukprot:scaffold64874_cov36-Tisochrysis_lutea.AAC.1